jgi:hypothetical protein
MPKELNLEETKEKLDALEGGLFTLLRDMRENEMDAHEIKERVELAMRRSHEIWSDVAVCLESLGG